MIKEPCWDKAGGPELGPLGLLTWGLFLNFLIFIMFSLSMYGILYASAFLAALKHKKAPMAFIEEVNISPFEFPFTMIWIIFVPLFLFSGLTLPFHAAFGFVEVDEENRTVKRYLQIKNKRYLVKTVLLSDVIEVVVSSPMSRMWGRRSMAVFYKRGGSLIGLKRMLVIKTSKDPLNLKIWKYMEENGVRLRIV